MKEKLKQFWNNNSVYFYLVVLFAFLIAIFGTTLYSCGKDVINTIKNGPQKSDDYYEGYDAGYNEGRNDGLFERYENGYEEGYDEGYNEGYDKGFEEGADIGSDEGYYEGYGDGYSEGYSQHAYDSTPIYGEDYD